MFLFLHILRDKSLFQSTPKCTGRTSVSLAWMQKYSGCFPLYNALCLTSPDICHILFPPFPHICWVVFSAMFTLFLQVGRVSKCLCWPSAIILTCAESIPVTITTPWEVCIFSEQNMCLEKIRQHLNRRSVSLCFTETQLPILRLAGARLRFSLSKVFFSVFVGLFHHQDAFSAFPSLSGVLQSNVMTEICGWWN